MKIVIIPIRRGQNRGRFGWCAIAAPEVLLQSTKTFASEAEARADAAANLPAH